MIILFVANPFVLVVYSKNYNVIFKDLNLLSKATVLLNRYVLLLYS